MAASTRFEEILELLDQAAFEPDAWRDVIAVLTTAYRGASLEASYLRVTHIPSLSVVHETSGRDSKASAVWSGFAGRNPFIEAGTSRIGPGRIYRTHDWVSDDRLERTEFYQDWLRQQDVHYGLVGVVHRDAHFSARLALARPKDAGPFHAREERLLARLLPHAQRAFVAGLRLRRLDVERRALGASIGALDEAVLVLGPQGDLVFANAKAMRLLAGDGGIRIGPRGLLCCEVPADTDRVRTAVASALGTNRVSTRAGGLCAVTRTGALPLVITIVPIRSETVLGRETSALLLVRDPEGHASIDPEHLVRLFGLTPAEARLASRLADGDDLPHVARELGIARETARNQLKAVFMKTGTRRQVELVRLILLTLPVRSFDGL